MLSPRAIRYDQKTSAEARRLLVALAPTIAAIYELIVATPGGEEAFLSVFGECEEELGRCDYCSVKLSGDDKGNTLCQGCLEQEAEE